MIQGTAAVKGGGYPKEWFVDSHDELNEYICPFCMNISRDAQQCKNSHLFCCNCATEAQRKRVKCCPTCTTGSFTLANVQNNIFARKLIEKFNVRCVCFSSNNAGCGWIGPLKDRHIREELCPELFVAESQEVIMFVSPFIFNSFLLFVRLFRFTLSTLIKFVVFNFSSFRTAKQ
jgi:hypothetical protein